MNTVTKSARFAPVAVPKKIAEAPPEGLGTKIGNFIADHPFLILTLSLALVVSIIYGVYAFGIASNLYVSEAKFAIRSVDSSPGADMLGGLDGGGTNTPESVLRREATQETSLARSALALAKRGSGNDDNFEQNPFVIANYLMSRAFVRELQAADLLKQFARPSVDALSRLPEDASLEEAWRFWSRHAMAAVDRRSNTIVLKVWAFTPADAQATVEQMIRRSEALMNEIEARGRQDALNRARAELDLATSDYDKKLNQISNMRQLLATVDPKTAATAAQKSLLRVEGERILMARELQVLQAAENANSPSANTLRLRSKSMVSEAGQLRDRITGYEADVHAAVNALAAYEELDLNRRFALMRVQIARLAVETADMMMRQNSYFIYTFIAPSLPVLPTQSWRIQQWGVVTFLTLLAWLGTVTFVTLNRDSRY